MSNHSIHILIEEATNLLKQLIATPSFSKEEEKTGDLIAAYLETKGIPAHRLENNIWARNKHFDPAKPTILRQLASRPSWPSALRPQPPGW